jgi:UDP-2-acetamido-2,6-beta-L-arabino-hexul-4-ose reductase
VKVLVTGADGFLGWHLRARLRALTAHEVVVAHRRNWAELPALVSGVDAVIHVAGVNRGGDTEVEQGNIRLAGDLVAALRTTGAPFVVVFANSIQSGNDTPYGAGKAAAARLLANLSSEQGFAFVDVRLPNLFGEHGRPAYNSFVATFVHAVISGKTPEVTDRPVGLLHAQRAAQSLIDQLDCLESAVVGPESTSTSVQSVFDTLHHQNALYAGGDVPELFTELDVDLFNTLRASLFPSHYPVGLTPRSDNRGSLVEVVRAHGGQGQTFVSTTRPGITRGEHFHLRKIERFVVLSGEARISLRRLLTDEVVTFDVRGDRPAIVDMPTMWVHNITNTGPTELTTLFWTHELFDPEAPDTFPEKVRAEMLVGSG